MARTRVYVSNPTYYNPKHWGAVADGSTADDTPFDNILTDIGSDERVIHGDPGASYLASSKTFPSNVAYRPEKGTILKPANGVALTFNGPVEAGPYQIFDTSAGGAVQLLGGQKVFYPQWWGAKGDGVNDDTAAIAAAGAALQAAGGGTLVFPNGTYKVSKASAAAPTALASLSNLNGIKIVGEGATIQTADTFTAGTIGWTFLEFTNCKNIEVSGLKYVGVAAFPGTYRQGTVFLRFKQNNHNVKVKARVENAAYGIWAGDYATDATGNSSNFDVTLDAYDVGYPVGFWESGYNSRLQITAEQVHRALYIAGGKNVTADVRVKDYDGQAACLLTGNPVGDATTATEERHCQDIILRATDSGSTYQQAGTNTHYLAGIAVQSDAGAGVGRNIDITINLKQGAGSQLYTGGVFIGNQGVTSSLNNPNIELQNVRVSGVVDRSEAPSTINPQYAALIGLSGKQSVKLRNFRLQDFIVKENTTDPAAIDRGIAFYANNVLSDVVWDNVRGLTRNHYITPPADSAKRHIFTNSDTSTLVATSGLLGSIVKRVDWHDTGAIPTLEAANIFAARNNFNAGVTASGAFGSGSTDSGIIGNATTTGTGVYGKSVSGAGVIGTSTSSAGIFGSSSTTDGVGVYGTSVSGRAIRAYQSGDPGASLTHPSLEVNRVTEGTQNINAATLLVNDAATTTGVRNNALAALQWDGVNKFVVSKDGLVTTGGWLKGSATPALGTIAANSVGTFNITVTGAAEGDSIAVSPAADPGAGLVWSAYVSASDTVTVRVANPTGSDIVTSDVTWKAAILKQ